MPLISATSSPAAHGMQLPLRRAALFGVALLAAAIIGVFDQATGWELSLFVLYGVPIFFVVWYGTWELGMAFSLVCTVIWWLANQAENPYTTSWGYQLAALSRFIYFSMVVVGGSILKMKRRADEVRIRALEKLHEMEREIVRVSEREQRRIGQDLHDGLCQHLAAIGCAAKSLADDLEKDGTRAEAVAAGEIVDLIKGAVVEVREVARGMFPVQVDLRGLGAALDELAATTSRLTSAEVSFTEAGEVIVPETETAMHLYRIAQEAVANAIKHGKADHIMIALAKENGIIRLTIDDDGCGFFLQPGDPGGMGLRTMAYRARAIGASLEISERDGPGTCVQCEMPLPESPASDKIS
jgi:signal transduction histidine kinase